MAKPRHKDGPQYPHLTGLDRYRRDPNPDRHAYGQAVLAAIRTLQRRELARVLPSHPCPCASDTWESDGRKIRAAVRQQNRRG